MGSPFDDVFWTNLSRPELRPVKVTRFDPATGKVLEGEGEVVLPTAQREKPITRSCCYCGRRFETYRRDGWPDARTCPECERERRSARSRKRYAREHEEKAQRPVYHAFDKLTGRRVADFATVKDAAEGIGLPVGRVNAQVQHGTWSKGWLSVRTCSQLHDEVISQHVAPIVLDDGCVKVAFSDPRACADALGCTTQDLRSDTIAFQGRTCTIEHVTRPIDDAGIRRWPPEANESLLPARKTD